jgi:hypothetical protein
MSHLGNLLSALVDGELSGTELDRASAHLAGCAACQSEAGSLRQLKQELHALAEVADADGLTRRLLAMALFDQDEPVQGEPVQGGPNDHGDYARRVRGQPAVTARPGMAGPHPARPPGRSGRRGRYVLWGTVSLVVVGIGTAAFGMGGSEGSGGPSVTPPAEMYDLQHAITSGDLPFSDPSGRAALVPAASARP